MPSDFQIAQKARKKPIEEIARALKINRKYLFHYGRHIAKIDLSILDGLKNKKRGKCILVTAITPTPLGEGKTVTTIGLSMSLNRLGKLTAACIRQPSLGPVFGIKGSAGGGGYSQVLPREDFDLHFTGDAHAVGLAHNLAAAFLDNSIFKGNPLGVSQERIYWNRVVDIGDRFLRHVKIGLKLKEGRFKRDSGFEITAASEIMAILALSRDLKDLRSRLSRIVLAETAQGKPVTTKDIKADGIMAVLLKDAIKPNLIQTIENTPCFVHTGPFANIAHGNSSIIQDEIALKLCDFIVTEAGFGADCGAEKFFDIKSRVSGVMPSAVVLVCSVRALKAHSGICKIVPGRPLDKCLTQENLSAVEQGLCNLKKQIENVLVFGVPVVVAVNRFASDTDREIELVRQKSLEFGAIDAQVSEVWSRGSKGGTDLARSVIKASSLRSRPKLLYPQGAGLKEKIKVIATVIYGAKDVEYSEAAERKISDYTSRGWDKFCVCMAKTPLSLSHDPALKGCPGDFTLPVRDIRAFAGAGFVSALCADIEIMPGLPRHPRGENIGMDASGNIIGLS